MTPREPAIGTELLYIPDLRDRTLNVPGKGVVPFAAKVVFVHNDRVVNIVCYGHRGEMMIKEKVHLIPEGHERPIEGGVAVWPKRQATLADELATEVRVLRAKLQETQAALAERGDALSVRIDDLESGWRHAPSGNTVNWGSPARDATTAAGAGPSA